MKPGSQINDNINLTVPSDAPRTSLMAVVTENLRLLTSAYWDRFPDGSIYAVQNTTYPYAYYIPKTPEGVESNDLSFTPLSFIDAPSSSNTLALPQQGQTSLVNLDFMTVRLSYPALLQPGETATLRAEAVSNYDFELDNLAVQIFITDRNGLKQIATGTIAGGVIMTSGSQLSGHFNFTVPSDAPSSSLLAVITENVKLPTYSSSYYYGYNGESAQQNSAFPYNYRMSPAPVGTQANDISYVTLSYVNSVNLSANSQSEASILQEQSSTQKEIPIQTLPQDANASQNQINAPSAQNQTNQTTLVQLLVALVLLVGVLGTVILRRARQKSRTAPNSTQ
jgi:hypothetical protein